MAKFIVWFNGNIFHAPKDDLFIAAVLEPDEILFRTTILLKRVNQCGLTEVQAPLRNGSPNQL